MSVIIPTFDRGKEELKKLLINRALNSVYNQTYKNIEIIVVIDGNSDTCKALLDKEMLKHNIKYYEYGQRVGAATTRNYGVEKASGKWIAFLDDDDEWMETKIEKQVLTLRKYPNSICINRILWENKIIPRWKYNSKYDISEYLCCRSYGRKIGIVQTSSIMVSKKNFNKIKFKDGLKKHQDWDWIIRAEQKFDIIQLAEPLSFYHVDSANKMSKKNMWNYSLWWINTVKKDISAKAYTSFVMEYVIFMMFEDNRLSKKEKIKIFINIFRKLPIKHKFSYNHYLHVIKKLA